MSILQTAIEEDCLSATLFLDQFIYSVVLIQLLGQVINFSFSFYFVSIYEFLKSSGLISRMITTGQIER